MSEIHKYFIELVKFFYKLVLALVYKKLLFVKIINLRKVYVHFPL
jgi:hypothetical protein